MLLNPKAQFALAVGLRGAGISLADAFSFASGLYFRGKIAYARRFAGPGDVVRVITTNCGLLDPEQIITPRDLQKFAQVGIDAKEERYIRPLRRDAERVREELGPSGGAILLGSVATGKYRDVLLEIFGGQLRFPADFVGRGDMSRGALMLHAAKSGSALTYLPVEGAILKGKRASSFRSVKLGLVEAAARRFRHSEKYSWLACKYYTSMFCSFQSEDEQSRQIPTDSARTRTARNPLEKGIGLDS